jgi:hypothetical protein
MANIESKIILNLLNEVTNIHNLFMSEKHFAAGFALCFHQQHLVELLRMAEKQEKDADYGNPPITP